MVEKPRQLSNHPSAFKIAESVRESVQRYFQKELFLESKWLYPIGASKKNN